MIVTLYWMGEDYRAYGVRMLSAVLKRQGHQVRTVFAGHKTGLAFTDQELEQLCLAAQGVDLVGISLTTVHFNKACQLTYAIKGKNKVTVIWGGVHPTVAPHECLDVADLVCVGEGEVALTALASQGVGLAQKGFPGIWYKAAGIVVSMGVGPLVDELDALPRPDYEGAGHFHLVDQTLMPINDGVSGDVTGNMYETFTTRGCTGRCTYCANSSYGKLYGTSWGIRKRSIRCVIEELCWAKDAMSAVREISLNDDAFMARTLEEVEDFAHQYRIRVNLPLRIYGLVSGLFNIHKVAALVDAGLYFVRMGIQTGSPKMRRIYGRRQTDNEVVEAAHVLHSFHHKLSHICYDIIIDSPWDSARDLDKTIMLLSRLPLPYSLNVFSLIMYPGTVLREMAIKEGILAGDRLKQAYWDSTILPSSRSFVRRIFSSIGCRTCREKPVPWLMYRVCLFFYMVGVVGFAEVRSFLNIMKVWLIRRFAPRPNMEPMFGWQLNHAETDKRLLTRIRRFILMHANVSLSIPWHCETTVSIGCNTQMGKCLYLTGTYEPNEFAWLNEVLATGMVVLDAGANVGLYTVFMAKKVGSGGKVIAVEPSKREMCYLKENCRRNNLENVLLRQVALAANTGHAELCVAPDEYNGLNSIGRFRYPDIPVAAREMVKTMTIDDLVEECGLSRLDFIKLDVEGSEYEVLRGAYRTIQQHHPAIMIEYERSRPGTRLLDPEFEKLLLQYSYRYQPLTSIGAVEQKGFVNLVGTIIAFHPLGTVRIKQ